MAPNPKWPNTIPIDRPLGQFLSPDPTQTMRVDFTEFFQRFQVAPDAHPYYKHLFLGHQQLAKMLLEHPAMEPNRQQTFSTPAKSKNVVYFMWDFVLRTFQILAAQVSPQSPNSSPMFMECVGRASTAKMMILDTTGQLASANMDNKNAAFTDEIKALAEKLDEQPKA